MEEAKSACTIHPPGPLTKVCVADVINTGDIESASESFYGQKEILVIVMCVFYEGIMPVCIEIISIMCQSLYK